MKICFLLGSGISRPAGLPGVDQITRQVLATEDFFPLTDEVYLRVGAAAQPNPFLARIHSTAMEQIGQFLRWLKGHAELRYATTPDRQVNYEDLAYLATQVRDDALDEYDNPALGPLICCALNAFPALRSPAAPDRPRLGQLANKTVDYISCVVAEMLASRKPAYELSYLKPFFDAVTDKHFEEVTLFTLNHDTLLEQYLRYERVQVLDGFANEDALGIRRWNPAVFDSWRPSAPEPSVRLFKLHGSIDWRRFRPEATTAGPATGDDAGANPWREEYLGIRSNPNLEQKRDHTGRRHEEVGGPSVLVGTFNKMLRYLNYLFLELHYRFHKALAETDRLVVCGYGFGDKGINNRVTDWMCLSPKSAKRMLVVIDPRSRDKLRRSSRGAIGGKLSSWEDHGRLRYVHHPLGSPEVTWGGSRSISSHIDRWANQAARLPMASGICPIRRRQQGRAEPWPQ